MGSTLMLNEAKINLTAVHIDFGDFNGNYVADSKSVTSAVSR